MDGAGPTGWLLAIDSATEQAGLALSDGERVAEVSWNAGRTQTVTLLGQVDRLLDLVGVPVGDLAAVAVSQGPGTFNGLRVGMAVAKGLVLATGAALVGVPTLDAAALPFATGGRPTLAVLAAGRGRLVWAAYGLRGDRWGQTAPPRNGLATELASEAAALGPGTVVTGELSPEQEASLIRSAAVTLPPRLLRTRRPAATAALAWDRLRAGDRDDPAALEPVYLHGTAAP